MTVAFHGDPGIKAALLARLRVHIAAGTLVIGPTCWDGIMGSPMGASAESEDSGEYAERFGYPLPLAALLDTMIACAAPQDAVRNMLAWVEEVEPGADLSLVPWRIADDLLIRLKADHLAEPHHRRLGDLHRTDLTREPVPRAEWAALRTKIESSLARKTGEASIALKACAITCWSLRTSRSVLVELVDCWRQAVTQLPDPDFDAADHSRAQKMLNMIWAETQTARNAGEAVHIPTLFKARDPDLAARFEENLARSNAMHEQRTLTIPSIVLRHLR